MTDFLDQYAAQFRAAAEAEAGRGRRVAMTPLAVAGLAAAAVVIVLAGGDAGPRRDEIEQTPRPAAGYPEQRELLSVLREQTEADADPQVRATLRDFRDERPRAARLLGKAPSGSAYVLVATARYRVLSDPRRIPAAGESPDVRWRPDGLCLVRRGTQGGASFCGGTADLMAGRLRGAIAGQVYGLVPNGVTHVDPPRGRPPVRVRRNFYVYAARGNPGPPPVWLDARGDEVPQDLPFLNRPGSGSLADFRGEVTVVGLWASWCGPCATQLRALQELSVRGISVVGVASSDVAESARDALAREGVDFPVLEDADARIAQRRDVTAFPETFVFGPDGKVAARLRGLTSAGEIEEAVSRAR